MNMILYKKTKKMNQKLILKNCTNYFNKLKKNKQLLKKLRK